MTDFDMNTLPAALDRLQNGIARLNERQDNLEVMLTNQEAPRPAHNELFAALAKAQAEIKNAEHDAEADAGPYKYKYATLDAVLNAIRGPLSKNGLSFIQMPTRVKRDDVELLGLTTILAHTSGQSIENYFEMYPPKRDPQGIGSAMTYMRRYVLMAMTGIAGAADLDAENTKPAAETITAAECDQILALADELFGSDADALLERMCDKIFGVDAVSKIPKGQAEVAMKRIENTRKRKDAEKQKPAAKKPAKPPADDDVTPSA